MTLNKWVLDPTHSELQFKVKHLMITNVTGSFTNLTGEIESENTDFNTTKISFNAAINSIHTGNSQRDEHLKSADFFDAENFEAIIFTAENYDASTGKVQGNLTIKNVTKPVELEATFNGVSKDPWGNEKAGFSINGKINRTDFGLVWNAPLETGGVLVSEEVKLTAEIQFSKSI